MRGFIAHALGVMPLRIKLNRGEGAHTGSKGEVGQSPALSRNGRLLIAWSKPGPLPSVNVFDLRGKVRARLSCNTTLLPGAGFFMSWVGFFRCFTRAVSDHLPRLDGRKQGGGDMIRISVICSAIMLLVTLACSAATTIDAPATPLPAAAALSATGQMTQPATPLPPQIAPTVAPIPTPTTTTSAAPLPTSAPPAPMPTATPVLFPYTVIDSLGREVIFEKPPERIVAYDSAPVEILFAIGEGHRIAGTHDFLSYPPEADDVPRLGGAFNINIEAVVAQDPDLVFIFFERFLPDLERAGLKVLFIETLNQDFTKIADSIRLWGRIVGNPAPAGVLADDFEHRVEKVRETMEPYASGMTIFQDEGDLWTPGHDTLIAEVFGLLKLRNIANDVSGYVQLSPEVIVDSNPQIIIASYGDTISDNPAFRDVLAVRNKRVFIPTSNAMSIAGPRYIDGIEELAKWAYPGIFR